MNEEKPQAPVVHDESKVFTFLRRWTIPLLMTGNLVGIPSVLYLRYELDKMSERSEAATQNLQMVCDYSRRAIDSQLQIANVVLDSPLPKAVCILEEPLMKGLSAVPLCVESAESMKVSEQSIRPAIDLVLQRIQTVCHIPSSPLSDPVVNPKGK